MRLIYCLLLALTIASSASATAPRLLDESLRQELIDLPRIGDAPIPQLDGKIVIVTFFASWCPPCRWEFEALNALRRKFDEKDLAIVAVNWFEDWDPRNAKNRMKRFLASTRPEFSLVSGNKTITERFGGIDRIPTLFVFDRSGQAAFTFIHLEGAKKMHAGESELTRVVEKLR